MVVTTRKITLRNPALLTWLKKWDNYAVETLLVGVMNMVGDCMQLDQSSVNQLLLEKAIESHESMTAIFDHLTSGQLVVKTDGLEDRLRNTLMVDHVGAVRQMVDASRTEILSKIESNLGQIRCQFDSLHSQVEVMTNNEVNLATFIEPRFNELKEQLNRVNDLRNTVDMMGQDVRKVMETSTSTEDRFRSLVLVEQVNAVVMAMQSSSVSLTHSFSTSLEPRWNEINTHLGRFNELRGIVEMLSEDVKKFTGRTSSSNKGTVLEEAVVAYMCQTMTECNVEKVVGAQQRGRMDVRVTRGPSEGIISMDLKCYSLGKALPKRDVDKFYKDRDTCKSHSILAVYGGFVPNTRRFDMHVNDGGYITVVLNHLETGDYSDINRACELIWLVEKLAKQYDDGDGDGGVRIDETILDNIHAQVDYFDKIIKDQKMHLAHAAELNSKMAQEHLWNVLRGIGRSSGAHAVKKRAVAVTLGG